MNTLRPLRLNMETIHFKFQGRSYSGYLVCSVDQYPSFYSVNFIDRELIERFGDSVSFIEEDDKISPHGGSPVANECILDILKELLQNRICWKKMAQH